MTEELNNFNTDLKEMFINNKLEDIVAKLNEQSDDNVTELTRTNYEVVKKYYDNEKYQLLFTHIKFVAFSCFLCEYTRERNLLTTEEQTTMFPLFDSIYNLMKGQQ